MASVAQIEANRLNAQKSTGPRTPEGKEKASRNAVKHGLLAGQMVIHGEDPREYDSYRAELPRKKQARMPAGEGPAGQAELGSFAAEAKRTPCGVATSRNRGRDPRAPGLRSDG